MEISTPPSTPTIQPYPSEPSPMPTGERHILVQLLSNSPLQQPQPPVQGAAFAPAASASSAPGPAFAPAAAAAALGAASASSTHTAAATVNTSASSSNKVKSQASQIKNPTDLKNALDNAPLNRHNYVILNQIAKKWLQAKRFCFVRSNLNSWSITVQIEVNPKLQAALQTHFTKGKFKSQTPADNNTRKRNLALATQLVDKRIIAMANRTLRIPIDGGKKISITNYFKRD